MKKSSWIKKYELGWRLLGFALLCIAVGYFKFFVLTPSPEGFRRYISWKNFYQISYPKDWYVLDDLKKMDNKNQIGILPIAPPQKCIEEKCIPGPEESGLTVRVEENTSNLNIDQLLEREGCDTFACERKDVMIDGERGIKVKMMCDGIGCNLPNWYVIKNGKIYSFTTGLIDNDKFDEVIKSFKTLF